jgi:hypothetical protein
MANKNVQKDKERSTKHTYKTKDRDRAFIVQQEWIQMLVLKRELLWERYRPWFND